MSNGRLLGDQMWDMQQLIQVIKSNYNDAISMSQEQMQAFFVILDNTIKDIENRMKIPFATKAVVLLKASGLSDLIKEKYNMRKKLVGLIHNIKLDFNNLNNRNVNELLFLIKERLLLEEYSYNIQFNELNQIEKIEIMINKIRDKQKFTDEEEGLFLKIVDKNEMPIHIVDFNSQLIK